MQVDNCVGKNKNHILVGYLGSHLDRGIICHVKIQFYNGGDTRTSRSITSSHGVFEGMAPSIFTGGIPAAGNAPPLDLKTIDSGSDGAYNDALQGDSIKS